MWSQARSICQDAQYFPFVWTDPWICCLNGMWPIKWDMANSVFGFHINKQIQDLEIKWNCLKRFPTEFFQNMIRPGAPSQTTRYHAIHFFYFRSNTMDNGPRKGVVGLVRKSIEKGQSSQKVWLSTIVQRKWRTEMDVIWAATWQMPPFEKKNTAADFTCYVIHNFYRNCCYDV